MMYIRVTVHSKTKKEKVVENKPGYFEVWIKESPVRGMANKKIIELIRQYLDIKGEIKIVSGHHHPKKMLSID